MKITLLFKYVFIQFLSFFIKPRKEYWIFSSSFNNQYNYNSKYLFEFVLKNCPDVNCKFVINDDEKRNQLIQIYGDNFIETKSLLGMIDALKAGVWFTSAGLPIYILFSGNNRHIVNLWHGVPLKKIGLLENNYSRIKKIYFKKIFSDNYSIILTTSDKLVKLMASSFGVEENKIKVFGQPRNDLLNKTLNKKEWLAKTFPQLPEFNNLLLYAPTYREFSHTRLFPFDDFNFEKLDKFLEEEKIILFIRMHQSEVNPSLFKVLNKIKRIQFINNDLIEDIMEVLSVFDLLITDYSSLYIDHLILEKPQLFIPYDLNEYKKLRGLNFEYDKYTPGPKVNDFVEFKNEIKKLLSDSNYYKNERLIINNYFNQIRKNSCEKVVNHLEVSLCGK